MLQVICRKVCTSIQLTLRSRVQKLFVTVQSGPAFRVDTSSCCMRYMPMLPTVLVATRYSADVHDQARRSCIAGVPPDDLQLPACGAGLC